MSLRLFLIFLALSPSVFALPEAPTQLTGSAPNPSNIDLMWQDNASDETGFEVEINDGSGFRSLGVTSPDVTGIRITRLLLGSTYTFRIAAVNNDGKSPYSNTFALLLRQLELVESAEYSGTAGEAFSQVFTFRDLATNETFLATSNNLPPGLEVDPATGTVSGTLTGGQYTGFSVTPSADDYGTEVNIVLDVKAAPIALSESGDALSGATTLLDLERFYDDPDIGTAVRFTTTEGIVDVGLFDDTTPITVTNFLVYTDSGAWENTFVHRAAKLQDGTPFVNQGGGYRPVGDGTYESIPDLPPIMNEFDRTRPNGKGTISMAKLGGNPNSATNEWFFSLANNTGILDNQNGGFTVFGKVLGDSETVLSLINDLPRATFEFTLDGFNRTFSDWPLRNGATSIANPDDLVSISVQRTPALTFVVTPPADAPFTTSVSGSQLLIQADEGATGTFPLSVEVTDLDGLKLTSAFMATLIGEPTSLATFAAKHDLANDLLANNDGDTLPALLEYALAQDPTVRTVGIPSFSTDGDGPMLVFPLITRLDDIVATVETSADARQWISAWSSEEGLSPQGNLVEALASEDGDRATLTVSSGIPFSDEPNQFMRLRVTVK